MAQATASPTDRDLVSVQEARSLAQRAKQAAPALAEFTQEQIDRIVDAMAAATRPCAEAFARLAVEETTYGVVADKIQKNLFASERVYEFIRPMKTVGVVHRDEAKKVVEIAEPFGVVAAIVPSTNPTSTAIYKILISIKARCPIVISPHPSAAKCITRVAEVMHEAAIAAGAPAGSINWMKTVTLEGTQELMKHRDVAVILATGGMGLVRAAYSAGKPAYGVGPGNAPCFIERTADLAKAASDIVIGKSFDNGVLCSSPNSVVVESAVADDVKREFIKHGAYFMTPPEADRLAAALVSPQRLPNPALVGKSAMVIAQKVGITVPDGTRALIAELKGVGRDYPLSIEKLCPVLSYYVVSDWQEGCERCKQILRYGGMGHTMSIHSRNEPVILEFGLKKPAFRIVVNTPTTHGSIGLTTGLDPAMTLGCGGYGGNITSDNISPRHLLNIKRLAYELRPAVGSRASASAISSAPAAATSAPALPKAPGAPPRRASMRRSSVSRSRRSSAAAAAHLPRRPPHLTANATVAPFVCEEDVRTAIKQGRKILVGRSNDHHAVGPRSGRVTEGIRDRLVAPHVARLRAVSFARRSGGAGEDCKQTSRYVRNVKRRAIERAALESYLRHRTCTDDEDAPDRTTLNVMLSCADCSSFSLLAVLVGCNAHVRPVVRPRPRPLPIETFAGSCGVAGTPIPLEADPDRRAHRRRRTRIRRGPGGTERRPARRGPRTISIAPSTCCSTRPAARDGRRACRRNSTSCSIASARST